MKVPASPPRQTTPAKLPHSPPHIEDPLEAPNFVTARLPIDVKAETAKWQAVGEIPQGRTSPSRRGGKEKGEGTPAKRAQGEVSTPSRTRMQTKRSTAEAEVAQLRRELRMEMETAATLEEELARQAEDIPLLRKELAAAQLDQMSQRVQIDRLTGELRDTNAKLNKAVERAEKAEAEVESLKREAEKLRGSPSPRQRAGMPPPHPSNSDFSAEYVQHLRDEIELLRDATDGERSRADTAEKHAAETATELESVMRFALQLQEKVTAMSAMIAELERQSGSTNDTAHPLPVAARTTPPRHTEPQPAAPSPARSLPGGTVRTLSPPLRSTPPTQPRTVRTLSPEKPAAPAGNSNGTAAMGVAPPSRPPCLSDTTGARLDPRPLPYMHTPDGPRSPEDTFLGDTVSDITSIGLIRNPPPFSSPPSAGAEGTRPPRPRKQPPQEGMTVGMPQMGGRSSPPPRARGVVREKGMSESTEEEYALSSIPSHRSPRISPKPPSPSWVPPPPVVRERHPLRGHAVLSWEVQRKGGGRLKWVDDGEDPDEEEVGEEQGYFCPAHHPLHPRPPSELYACNVCGARDNATGFYGCSKCDFDVCLECM